jgi:chemotaxis response regulator CheB
MDQTGLDLVAEKGNQVISQQDNDQGFSLELGSDAFSGFEEELEAEFKSFLDDQPSEEIVSLSKQSDTALVVEEKRTHADIPEGAAVNVWVLGASLGGPQAVRQFLVAIKEDLPVAFILAQHIGENHISLLAEQLDRVTKFRVFPGYNGHLIRHHEVILAPAGKKLNVTGDGYISLSDQEENAIYSPCINDVMSAVASRYGKMAGTIVFSGMGDDGAIGCQSVADNGGIVWAQDVDSCVISSMPDQARKTNNVTFSANPRRLADELYKYYRE